MKCFCGTEFEMDKDIPIANNRCPNCDRNAHDISSSFQLKKLTTEVKEFLEDSVGYCGDGHIEYWYKRFEEALK